MLQVTNASFCPTTVTADIKHGKAVATIKKVTSAYPIFPVVYIRIKGTKVCLAYHILLLSQT